MSKLLNPLLGFALAGVTVSAVAAPIAARTPMQLRAAAMPAALRDAAGKLLSGSRAGLPTGDLLGWIEQKVVADDGIAADAFGFSVAIDGNIALVGAAQGSAAGTGTDNGGAGAVYVFTRSGSTWTPTQKLTADDGVDNDQFGYSVALSGSTALIGASFAAVGGNVHQGAAYIFSNSGGSWVQTQKLTADDGAGSDQLGWSVALDGDTALIGAPGKNGAQGAAYVFVQANGSWTQSATLSADDGAAADDFGFAVAVHGTTAVISSANASIGSAVNQGAAYVFSQSGDDWLQGPKLVPDDGVGGETFGYSVAFDGSTALIGAPFATVGANLFQGAVYAYDAAGDWAQSQKLVAAEGMAFDVFGIAVSLSDRSAIVTAPFYNGSQGEAFLFGSADGSGWSEQHTFVAGDAIPGAGEGFGYTAVLSHGIALIGAPLAPIGGNEKQGAAYFYAADRIFADGFEPAAP